MATIHRQMSYIASVPGEADAYGRADVSYDTAKPFQINILFADASPPVDWAIDRDILSGRTPGPMDVQIEVDGVWTVLHLSSHEGRSDIRMMRAQVDAFLAATARAVPYGDEVLDFDAELESLLKDGAR